MGDAPKSETKNKGRKKPSKADYDRAFDELAEFLFEQYRRYKKRLETELTDE